jgi:hypothetical protein
MPYIGRQGEFGIRNRFQYLASADDTSVSGSDANGVTMTFSDGLYIDVYLNGVKLKAGEDYNTTTANTVAGISAMSANDEVEIIVYDVFTVADTVSASDGGTFSGAVTFNGDISVGDDLTLGSDSAVINMGADSDVTITHNADKGVTLNDMDISGLTSINGTDSGSGANYGQIGGRRNMVYNGDMQICQRDTSVSGVGDGDSGYHVQDRWKYGEAGSPTAVVTMSQSTDTPDGFHSSLKMDCTTASGTPDADDVVYLLQWFEGQDLQGWNKGDAQARSVTLSFWVKTTKTGTYIVNLYDADNTRHISKAYTVNVTNTWEYKTLTFEGDTSGAWDNDNAGSLAVQFGLSTGTNYTSGTLATSWEAYDATNLFVGQVNALDNTNNNFYITGVQMELGDTATAFEYEGYGENLARCQRYYQSQGGESANAWAWKGSAHGAFYDLETKEFPVPMRAAATVTKSGTFATTNTDEPSAWTEVEYAYHWQSQADAAGQTSINSNSSGKLAFDAEL